MRSFLILIFAATALCSQAQDLVTKYAADGRLLLVTLRSAPFPHPLRSQGHKYHDQFFSAGEHYSDSTVAIFIPSGFSETKAVDFVVHFHGWNNHVSAVLPRYRLIEQLMKSGRDAILVVPQGPRDAPDSFGGKLEDKDGFKTFITEVMEVLRNKSILPQTGSTVGRIILSGHSGGYEVISSILEQGGLSDQIREVWLFDAAYGRTEKFIHWFEAGDRRLLDIYTEHGGTKTETEKMMAEIKARGGPVFSGDEATFSLSRVPWHSACFIFSALEHNDVVDKHQTFEDFLKTSCLDSRKTGGPEEKGKTAGGS